MLEKIEVLSLCRTNELTRTVGAPHDEVVVRSNERLEFVSPVHPRDVELLPLMGERVYYLPLRSDHYTLDWACSFTGGDLGDSDS